MGRSLLWKNKTLWSMWGNGWRTFKPWMVRSNLWRTKNLCFMQFDGRRTLTGTLLCEKQYYLWKFAGYGAAICYGFFRRWRDCGDRWSLGRFRNGTLQFWRNNNRTFRTGGLHWCYHSIRSIIISGSIFRYYKVWRWIQNWSILGSLECWG